MVAGGQLHQAYDGFACYLDLETYDGPLEGTFAALKPISQYMKGNLPEDLFLNSVLTLLHPPQREPTLSISLTTAVRKRRRNRKLRKSLFCDTLFLEKSC